MVTGDIKPIPNSFLSKLLKEFGIEWTQLVIISGAVLSSFDLQSYISPGVWILGTLAAFSFVYLFKDDISGRFPKVCAICIPIAMIILGAPVIALVKMGFDLKSTIQSWTTFSTLYVSIVLGIPLGVMIISYRKRDQFRYAPLSAELEEAVQASIMSADFVHRSIAYELKFRRTSRDEVVLWYEVIMKVENRSHTSATYRDVFAPAGGNRTFFSASVAGTPINVRDRERLSLLGLTITREVPAGETFEVRVSAESTYFSRDSEMIGSYFPSSSLSILIRQPPADLDLHPQPFLRKKIEPDVLPSGDLSITYADGVLPFQGIRLLWDTRSGC